MFILYDLIFLVFAVVYLPVLFFKKKMHPSFGVRLGKFAAPELGRPIWIHAVSVGEAVSVKHLVEGLRYDLPGTRFVLSTVTPTGNAIAKGIAGKNDFVTYLPLDLSFIVRRTLARINPRMLVIVETELWPNLIYFAAKRGIPIAVVNARLSDRSFACYRMAKFLVAPLLNRVSVFCVQTARDAEKLRLLGLKPEKIRMTGNMKFDITVKDYDELRKDYQDYRLSFGIGSKEKLLVAASTHTGEEQMVLGIYSRLRGEYPNLRLLIAPRHPERSPEVERFARAAGVEPVLVSRISTRVAHSVPAAPQEGASGRVFILDTIGKLMYFYAISDIVFVGGSLVPKGGHNILEPASLGKPVIFGKYMHNFRDIAGLFLSDHAALMAADEAQLEREIRRLLAEPAASDALGSSAREIINRNKGATARNRELLRNLLQGS